MIFVALLVASTLATANAKGSNTGTAFSGGGRGGLLGGGRGVVAGGGVTVRKNNSPALEISRWGAISNFGLVSFIYWCFF
ncbi:hypothetical protein M5689_000528 [Euphorbia peplus]|nr:hypothetical protein M5689_000528 [Euphorbia peplus]